MELLPAVYGKMPEGKGGSNLEQQLSKLTLFGGRVPHLSTKRSKPLKVTYRFGSGDSLKAQESRLALDTSVRTDAYDLERRTSVPSYSFVPQLATTKM
jgi:hypothetical protein